MKYTFTGIVVCLFLHALFQSSFAATQNENYVKTTPFIYTQKAEDANQTHELEAKKIKKGEEFSVVLQQNISVTDPKGTVVSFNSQYPYTIFTDKGPTDLSFFGKIVKTTRGTKGCKGGAIKIKIDKIKIGNIVYPASAFISRKGNKPVMLGTLKGQSNYLPNLIDVANNGTGTAEKIYHDPCEFNQCLIASAPKRTAYYFTAGFLQLFDLISSPFIALMGTGSDLYIPKDTKFEIKLDEDMTVLDI